MVLVANRGCRWLSDLEREMGLDIGSHGAVTQRTDPGGCGDHDCNPNIQVAKAGGGL